MKKIIPLLLAALFIFSGCDKITKPLIDNTLPTDTAAGTPDTTSAPADVDFDKTDADMFTEDDIKASYDGERTVTVTLSEDGIKTSSDAARVSGKTVSLTEAVTYIISGSAADAMIVVNAKKDSEMRIVLDGASITSKTSAPIYILKAGKVTLTLEKENRLANGGAFTQIDDNNIDAVIYSKCDLTINGSGSLTISSPAGHGISCKDDLIITGGVYSIASASHGIDANDSIRLKGADITIDAGKDGIHAENTDDATLGYVYISDGKYKIEAEGDGISASAALQIESGEYDIVTGGGSANAAKKSSDSFGGFMGGPPSKPGKPGQPPQHSQTSGSVDDSESIKGIKAATGLLISGGSFKIDSADDALHSNADLTLNGGSFDISTGDDGMHADETLTITAGKIDITKSYEALEGLHVNISGGDISSVSTDDGINAAGGNDESGFGGGRGDMFSPGGRPAGPGGMGSGNGSIVISGGNVYIQAAGDGIDANGTLDITGGSVTVCAPTTGDTSVLDYDRKGVISGGVFVGTGARNMVQTLTGEGQGVISLISNGKFSAGTKITLYDDNGNLIFEYSPMLDFQIFIYSSPEIKSNESYILELGGNKTTLTAK